MSLTFSDGKQELSLNARAAVVNRTHRIIRERALALQSRKRTVRDLVVPILICSTLLLFIGTAAWTLADEGVSGWEGGLWHRFTELGGDAGSTVSILLVWFLPLSVVTAAAVMLRKTRLASRSDEAKR
ncbi:MAG: hypothetical protein ACRYF4_11455 [Janthinobacterium lividum]